VELPGEVGAEEVRQIGAVGREPETARAVLAEAEMVVEEIPAGVARDRVE
jgi:hypothetical protein